MMHIVSWIIRASLAGVMELVDVPDSKSGAARRGGSSPPPGTTKARRQDFLPFFFLTFFIRGSVHDLETERHRRRCYRARWKIFAGRGRNLAGCALQSACRASGGR